MVRSAPVPLLGVLRLAVTVVLGLAVVGAVISSQALSRTVAPAVPVAVGRGPFLVGQTIRTSWGYLAAESVQSVAGVSNADLGHAAGAGGNVHDLVTQGQQELQVTVALTSAQKRRLVSYAPSQFRLRVGTARTTIAARLATLLRGQLQPLAVVEGHVGFLGPSGGGQLWLEYADPGRPQPFVIDLGRVAPLPSAAHDHSQH